MKTDRLRKNVKKYLRGGLIAISTRQLDEEGVFRKKREEIKVEPVPRSTPEILDWINRVTTHGTTQNQLCNILSKDYDIVQSGFVKRTGNRYGSYRVCSWTVRELIWKKIDDCPYEVSYDGQIRRIETGYVLKPGNNRRYLRVELSRKQFMVHHLVGDAFLGIRPDGYIIHHKNGDAHDNRADNLEYKPNGVHQREHIQEKLLAGTCETAKLTPDEIQEIRKLYAITGASTRDLATQFNVDNGTISNLISGKSWKGIESEYKKPSRSEKSKASARRRSKLCFDDVEKIKSRYGAGGISMKNLGEQYEISASQVHRIVHGQRWGE